ncbi:hypothetical protein [Brucella anthropi]|uniref:hypothetical protein n=1 Tax=Brucella anthropi TaxID=529 RepID=UPI0021667CB8|nr:hypothetical protein [Brucella anthropi]UVV66747.1 hypothetical protein NW321_09685 [Brucella anthropi]
MSRPGHMSRDRVKFKFAGYEKAREPNVSAAIQAFGMSLSEAGNAYAHEKTIVCRPSQFARFLILRDKFADEKGCSSVNAFRQLNAILFTPEESASPIDVSSRPVE